MNQLNKCIVFLGLLGASIGCGAANSAEDEFEQGQSVEIATEATYEVTFTSLWEVQAHLGRPQNAHFSPLVVSSHNSDYALLPFGELANKALEDVAETGSTRRIERELSEAVSEGVVDNFTITQNQFVPQTPVQSLTFKVTKESSLFSLVTMIAPSPDWVVGVDRLNLIDDQGEFLEDTGDIMLFAYDAGTEDGDQGGNFSINNSATLNPTPIQRLFGPGFEQPFALLRLKKIN